MVVKKKAGTMVNESPDSWCLELNLTHGRHSIYFLNDKRKHFSGEKLEGIKTCFNMCFKHSPAT